EAHVAEPLGDDPNRSGVCRGVPGVALRARTAWTIEVRRGEPDGTGVTVRARRGIGTADVDRATFRVVMIRDDDDVAARKLQIDPGRMLDFSCDESDRSR